MTILMADDSGSFESKLTYTFGSKYTSSVRMRFSHRFFFWPSEFPGSTGGVHGGWFNNAIPGKIFRFFLVAWKTQDTQGRGKVRWRRGDAGWFGEKSLLVDQMGAHQLAPKTRGSHVVRM